MFHTIKLSKLDPTPIYIQLASELSKLIEQGFLYEGMKLPTIRHLSKELCINRDTVVSAYKLLEQQGLVESHIGKGTYIAKHHKMATESLIPKSLKPHICCSHLNLSPSFFPSSLCEEITSHIIQLEGWEAFNDPLYRERKLLKQSASCYLESLGVKAHFGQMRIISNIEGFLLTLFKLSPKIGICMETPRDLTTSCYLRSIGAKIYEVPLTPTGMDVEILEKHLHTGTISYIFLSSCLQNPTGICYTKETMEKILELSKHYDCLIIDDLTYCDFLAPKRATFLNNLPHDEHLIYLYHFSKLYLPYIKYSFVALPVPLIKRFQDDIECSFNERFLRYYLNSNTFLELKKQILHECQNRYDYLSERLQPLQAQLKPTICNGGLSIWYHVPEVLYDRLCTELTKKDIIIAPGELFSNHGINGYFRLSISDISLEEIDEVVNVLTYLFATQNT